MWKDLNPANGKKQHAVDADGEYYRASDLNGYVCQQYGFYEKARFVIEVYDGGNLVCYGISPEYVPAEFFPEKEELLIGTDVLPEDICEISYHSSGMTIESNFSYTVVISDDEAVLYTGIDKEINLKKADVKRILETVRKGTIARKYVRDPEMIILDGAESYFGIRWNSMSEMEGSYYYLEMNDMELLDLFRNLEKAGGNSTMLLAGAGAAAIAAAAALLFRRKK